MGDGVKKAAEDTAKGAKGWWDKEVVGAKNAMDRRAGQEGDQGAPSDGDLYVKVAEEGVNKGGIIRRQGADLYTDVVVRYPRRGEDTSVRVRTVEGDWGNLKVASDAGWIGTAHRGPGAPDGAWRSRRGAITSSSSPRSRSTRTSSRRGSNDERGIRRMKTE